jgi:hypothetical protein
LGFTIIKAGTQTFPITVDALNLAPYSSHRPGPATSAFEPV